jgi:phosphoribosylformylglycinamidine synthase
MKAIVNIFLKEGVLDSQGKAVHHSLDSLGFANSVSNVRIGRQIVLQLNQALSEKDAKQEVIKMCESLLANTVIEDYEIELKNE